MKDKSSDSLYIFFKINKNQYLKPFDALLVNPKYIFIQPYYHLKTNTNTSISHTHTQKDLLESAEPFEEII